MLPEIAGDRGILEGLQVCYEHLLGLDIDDGFQPAGHRVVVGGSRVKISNMLLDVALCQ